MEYINKGKNGEIILSDGQGDAYFDFVEMIVFEGQEYAVLASLEDDSITVMRFTEADGKKPEIYSVIEDDETFEKIVALYEENED